MATDSTQFESAIYPYAAYKTNKALLIASLCKHGIQKPISKLLVEGAQSVEPKNILETALPQMTLIGIRNMHLTHFPRGKQWYPSHHQINKVPYPNHSCSDSGLSQMQQQLVIPYIIIVLV